MRIAGIDPGLGRIGYACLDGDGRTTSLVSAETIVVPPGPHPALRLVSLARELDKRLRRDRPAVVAVERLFFHSNAKTAMAVAEARGVILLTAARLARSIQEYTPLEIKLAVAGYGRADKPALRRMIMRLVPAAAAVRGDDAIDAIAVALSAQTRSRRLWRSRGTDKGRR